MPHLERNDGIGRTMPHGPRSAPCGIFAISLYHWVGDKQSAQEQGDLDNFVAWCIVSSLGKE